jgi:type I restriction enzyme S subunit
MTTLVSSTEWPRRPLGEIATIERSIVTPENIQSGTTYVGLENIDSSGEFIGVREVVNGELASAKFRFTSSHILYGKLRPYLSKIARPTFEGVCSTDILPILPGRALDRSYLHFFLRLPEMVALATSRSTGANLPRLSPSQLEEFEIPLPSLSEQRRLAAILDKANVIRLMRASIAGVLSDFPRRLFVEMFGNVVLNERAWKQVSVADAGDVQLGRQRSPKYQTGKFSHPYMRVANVFDDRIDLSDVLSMDFDERDFDTYRLESGDLLLNEGQSTELVGRPAMWQDELPDCCFQNTLIRFRADPNVTNPEFALAVFREYLHRGAFARISSKTSNVAHLGASRFAAMSFPLPPRDAQEKFAAARRKLRCAASTAHRACEESEDLFASLVDRAFRGVL